MENYSSSKTPSWLSTMFLGNVTAPYVLERRYCPMPDINSYYDGKGGIITDTKFVPSFRFLRPFHPFRRKESINISSSSSCGNDLKCRNNDIPAHALSILTSSTYRPAPDLATSASSLPPISTSHCEAKFSNQHF